MPSLQKKLQRFACCLLTILVFAGAVTNLSVHRIDASSQKNASMAIPISEVTLTPDGNQLTQIQSILSTEKNCKLLCFGDIDLDEVSLADVKAFVQINLSKINLTESTYLDEEKRPVYDIDWAIYDLRDIYNRASVRIRFTSMEERDDHVAYIHLNIRAPRQEWLPKSSLYLPDILKLLGIPSDIFIRIIPLPSSPSLFVWTLVYKEKRVTVQYVFNFNVSWSSWTSEQQNKSVQICPFLENTYSIEAWIINSKIPNTNWTTIVFPESKDWPLERITTAKVSIPEFVATFMGDTKNCLEILSYADLVKQEYPFR